MMVRPIRSDSQRSTRPGLAHEHLRSQRERNTGNNSFHFHLSDAVRDTRIRVESRTTHVTVPSRLFVFALSIMVQIWVQFGTRLPKYSFCIFQSVPASSTFCDKHRQTRCDWRYSINLFAANGMESTMVVITTIFITMIVIEIVGGTWPRE